MGQLTIVVSHGNFEIAWLSVALRFVPKWQLLCLNLLQRAVLFVKQCAHRALESCIGDLPKIHCGGLVSIESNQCNLPKVQMEFAV